MGEENEIKNIENPSWIEVMTDQLSDLAVSCVYRKGTRRDDAARCIAIAQTYIETAELWLHKAARYGEEKYESKMDESRIS